MSFIGSWFDPPKAKEAAFAMIDKGADVLYAERFGVSRRGQGEGQARHRQRDQHAEQYPETVVASALWNMEPTIDTRDQEREGRQVQAPRTTARTRR